MSISEPPAGSSPIAEKWHDLWHTCCTEAPCQRLLNPFSFCFNTGMTLRKRILIFRRNGGRNLNGSVLFLGVKAALKQHGKWHGASIYVTSRVSFSAIRPISRRLKKSIISTKSYLKSSWYFRHCKKCLLLLNAEILVQGEKGEDSFGPNWQPHQLANHWSVP